GVSVCAAATDHNCGCHIAALGVVADGVNECMRAARDDLHRGVHFLKMMGGGGVPSLTDKLTNMQYTEEESRAIGKVTESYDTFVTAHTYTSRSIRTCVENGIKGIEHANLMDEDTARLVAEKAVYVAPTLITYKVMSSDQFSSFVSLGSQQKNMAILETRLSFLSMAKKHNVKLRYGSDLLGGLTGYQTSDFTLRAQVLSAADILRSANITPAEALDVHNVIGQIKKGFYSDFLVLESNPWKI
ncbi:hypothetical protein KL936_002411, partial [Ogataea polymorpha]